MKLFCIFAATLLLLAQGGGLLHAGGPKCDRSDAAKCGMTKANCSGMTKDGKKSGSSCSNICHRGCCSCPDGSEPTEGEACPRDTPQGSPDEGQ